MPGAPPAVCVPPLPARCRVHRPEGCEAVVPGQVAAVAAARPDRAADPAAGAAGSSAGDDDAVLETVTSAANVGRAATARAGLSGTSVVSVEGSAAGPPPFQPPSPGIGPAAAPPIAADVDD